MTGVQTCALPIFARLRAKVGPAVRITEGLEDPSAPAPEVLRLEHIHGHRHYYESHGPRDHIHVACLRCGKVREFESRLFEQLKKQIERDLNVKITVTRTEIGGYCEACRQ